MKIFEWLAELRYRDGILYRLGMINLIIGVLLFLPLALDPREVLGINTWIKPIKFCFSLTIYLWTMGWMMFDLGDFRKWTKRFSWIIGITMLIEILVIIFQASRATRSHFNEASLLDGVLFGIMGLMIAINTIIIFVVFLMFLFGKTNLDQAYHNAVRLAFAAFLLGNWVGGRMIEQRGHAVGIEDGGDGLPFVNWSTLGGDLRIAHFLGLHALQLIPLFSYLLMKKSSLSLRMRTILATVFTIVYVALIFFLYQQAMAGQPLISN